MQELHFEVHLGEFTGGQEKCVDIALAVVRVTPEPKQPLHSQAHSLRTRLARIAVRTCGEF